MGEYCTKMGLIRYWSGYRALSQQLKLGASTREHGRRTPLNNASILQIQIILGR